MSIAAAQGMCVSAGMDDVVISRHDPVLDDSALNQVAWWFQQTISPLTAIESLDAKPWAGHIRHQRESLICDITGVTHLFDGEDGTMRRATSLLESLGLAGRMAIADTIGAAWAVSHHAIARTHDAADRCFVVPPRGQQSAIEPLDASALRIAPETVDTLSRLGIESIGQLLRLPRSGIAPRLGTTLVRRIEQALGEIDEPAGSFCADAEHAETLSLEYPTRDLAILADRVTRLIQAVRTGLATRQHGALRLTCRLDLSVHPPLTVEVGLFSPTTDVRHLAGLIHHRLESLRLPSDVTQVNVSVPLTGPLRSVQQSLFDDSQSGSLFTENSSNLGLSLSRLIDSLSGRLGRSAVVEIKRTGDALPESAYSITPLAGNASRHRGGRSSQPHRRSTRPTKFTRVSKPSPVQSVVTVNEIHEDLIFRHASASDLTPSPSDAMRRPLSLLSSPMLLVVRFADQAFARDTTRIDVPDQFRLHGVTHRPVRVWGPERIETGWWKGPSIRRDYYRIETDRSQWWWIFRDRVPTTPKDAVPNRRRSKLAGGEASDREPISMNTHSPVRYRWMIHGRFA